MVVEKLLSLNIPFAVVISTPFGIENSPLGKDVFIIFHESNKKKLLKEIGKIIFLNLTGNNIFYLFEMKALN